MTAITTAPPESQLDIKDAIMQYAMDNPSKSAREIAEILVPVVQSHVAIGGDPIKTFAEAATEIIRKNLNPLDRWVWELHNNRDKNHEKMAPARQGRKKHKEKREAKLRVEYLVYLIAHEELAKDGERPAEDRIIWRGKPYAKSAKVSFEQLAYEVSENMPPDGSLPEFDASQIQAALAMFAKLSDEEHERLTDEILAWAATLKSQKP